MLTIGCHPAPRGDDHGFSLGSVAFAVALAWLGGAALDVGAAGSPQSVFHIDRSKNDNQVHYRIDLDDACAPRGSEPVEPYWLRRSPGSETVEPIKWYQRRAYGVASQNIDGTTVTLTLRALPDREIVIRTGPLDPAGTRADAVAGDGAASPGDTESGEATDTSEAHSTTEAAESGNAAPARCRAEAFMTIAGREARLSRAYVASEEGFLLPKVLYIDLFGKTADGEPVEERVVPD